jgi:hypothetical protein
MKNAGSFVLGLVMTAVLPTAGASGATNGGAAAVKLVNASATIFLSIVNTLLGGGSNSFTINDLDPITADLNASFVDGAPSTFAQEHLFNGACPVWKNGDIVTYTQTGWLSGTLLTDSSFKSVYGSDFEIGTESGNYAIFTTEAKLVAFLPQISTPIGTLDSISVDSTSSSAGAFAGEVAALKLNVDFYDQSLISGNVDVKFGDVTLCGLSVSALNGMTVRTFPSNANTVLGGLSGPASVNDVYDTTLNLNASFASGPSTWAQQHLRNGACQ